MMASCCLGQEANREPGVNAELQQAKRLLDRGEIQKAQITVRDALAEHPDSVDGHYLLGYLLFREIQQSATRPGATQGRQYNELDGPLEELAKTNAQESLREYTTAARYRKPTAADLRVVAFDYVILGDFVDADKWLTRALEWNPEDAEGWYYLGRAKYNENRFEEAVRAFQACLKRDPANVKAQDNLGLSLEGLGKLEEASSAYRKAISWQPDAAGPLEDLGSLLLDQNNAQEAVNYLRRAETISPEEARIHEKLGKAYSALNQLRDAQRELQKAVELTPNNPRLHFMLGQVYRKQGLIEKAKDELARSCALNGTHSSPLR